MDLRRESGDNNFMKKKTNIKLDFNSVKEPLQYEDIYKEMKDFQ